MTAPEVKVTAEDMQLLVALRDGRHSAARKLEWIARHRATATAPLEARIALLEAAMRRIAAYTDIEADFDGFEARDIARTTLASLSAMLADGE